MPRKRLFSLLSILLLTNSKVLLASAAAPQITVLPDPGTTGGVQGLAENIFNKGFGSVQMLATVIIVFYFVWYGIMFVTSAGNPEKSKTAKQALINGIIGVAVMVAAYSFIKLGYIIANTINGAL